MVNVDDIDIEIVYALPEQAYLVPMKVAATSTIRQAIELSGLLQRFPEIDLDQNKVGIFGRIMGIDALLHAGDRVEIYRHLKIDPKDARRVRAEKKNKTD